MLKYGDTMLKTLTFVNKKNICKAGRILGVEKNDAYWASLRSKLSDSSLSLVEVFDASSSFCNLIRSSLNFSEMKAVEYFWVVSKILISILYLECNVLRIL